MGWSFTDLSEDRWDYPPPWDLSHNDTPPCDHLGACDCYGYRDPRCGAEKPWADLGGERLRRGHHEAHRAAGERPLCRLGCPHEGGPRGLALCTLPLGHAGACRYTGRALLVDTPLRTVGHLGRMLARELANIPEAQWRPAARRARAAEAAE